MYKSSIYSIGTRRKSVDLSCFGLGKFRIVGTRLGKPVIVARLNLMQMGILETLGVIAI